MRRGFAYLSLIVFIALGVLAYKERRAIHLLKNHQAIKEDLFEAVIRRSLPEITGKESGREVIFLSFAEDGNDHDPSDGFIARFRDLPVEIRKISLSVKDEYGAVKDKKGRNGAIIRLYGVDKQGFFKRSAQVGYYFWAWGAEGHLVHLELTDTGWKVTNVILSFIT
jgi:hypothetical protein